MNLLQNLPSQRAQQSISAIDNMRSHVKRCPNIRACEDVVIERSRRPYGVMTEGQWISIMYSCILAAHMVEDRTRELIEALKITGDYQREVKRDLNMLLTLTGKSSKQTYSVLDSVESPEQHAKRLEWEKRTGRRKKVHVGEHRNRAKMLYTLMTAEFDDQMENDILRMRAYSAKHGQADFIMLVETCKIFFLVREASIKLSHQFNVRFNHFDDMDQTKIEKSLILIAEKLNISLNYQDDTLNTWKRTLGVKIAKWEFIKELMNVGEQELDRMLQEGVIK